ncbi:type VII secretion protein EccB [Protofrankia symbiont of Coriaria ruscifolia]|uniref:type VII secretion protein EccB n=1 Tax=Protofrankia symbiont of Coriaria ruscifolia TaxID=1306542 RepID=UPI0010413291|nr:type VII secretion protein EccB [Protofrankia symbiont of Coriaria ruscifolia]
MVTRRDQLQSYQFLTQRVISAFVMRETDPQQSPLRRGIGAVFGGVMIAVVAATGFGVYGILTKTDNGAWKTDGSVVIEKETGASFVYSSGGLNPTLNLASAMLAAGTPNPRVHRIASRSLALVPRRVSIGIPGAPDSLPAAGNRVGLPWTLCTASGPGSSGRAVSTVTLAVASAPTGGRRLDTDEGMLAKNAVTGTTYLIWGEHRYQLTDTDRVVPALFGALVTAVPAGTSWLNALPAGAGIGPIVVNGRGRPSPAVPGHTIGELLVAETGSGPQYYLVFDDGLAAITPLQQAIASVWSPAPPTRISVSEATSAATSSRLSRPSGPTAPPRSPPALVTPAGDDLLCAVTNNAAAPPDIWVGGSVKGLATANPTGTIGPGGARLADRVYVPAGHVAIVRAMGAPNTTTGPYFVITDVGIRYAVPTPGVLAMLGYAPQLAVDVPADLVREIPAGPTLDPAAATRPAPLA